MDQSLSPIYIRNQLDEILVAMQISGKVKQPNMFVKENDEIISEYKKAICLLFKISFQMQNEIQKSISKYRRYMQNTKIKSNDHCEKVDDKVNSYYIRLKDILVRHETILRLLLNLIQEYHKQSERFNFLANPNPNHLTKLLNESAIILPLWIEPGKKAQPLVGTIPADQNYSPKVGDLVAALIANSNDMIWTLVQVIQIQEKKNFLVMDIDDKNNRIIVSQDLIIPLPLYRANPQTNPEALLHKNEKCLALYPQATCFYNGKVAESPVSPNGMYKIIFLESDDQPDADSLPSFEVPQRYVLRRPVSNDECVQPPKPKIRKITKDNEKL